MTLHEEHKARHKALHQALDELLADYLAHNPGSLSTTNCIDLMVWSFEQTKNPDEPLALCANCGQEIEDGHECEETA